MFCFWGIVLFFFPVSSGMAAQSTPDVPVSVAKKQEVLDKVRNNGEAASSEEYRIGCGDFLAVSIYDEGNMSVNSSVVEQGEGDRARPSSGILVRSDGRISLKDIGDVEVEGLTFTQLADYLKQLYAEIYDDPVLVTSLVQSNSRRYTVMGEVNKPGTYRLDNTMNAIQVVAEAGGFTKWAGKKIVVVRKELRKGDGKIFDGHKIVLDYNDFVSGEDLDKNIPIRSGDIIVVK